MEILNYLFTMIEYGIPHLDKSITTSFTAGAQFAKKKGFAVVKHKGELFHLVHVGKIKK